MSALETVWAMKKECDRASKEFAPFNSAHEGYAVILEELNELWDEVKQKSQSKERMREEAIQIGAMAIRFIQDLIDDPS